MNSVFKASLSVLSSYLEYTRRVLQPALDRGRGDGRGLRVHDPRRVRQGGPLLLPQRPQAGHPLRLLRQHRRPQDWCKLVYSTVNIVNMVNLNK